MTLYRQAVSAIAHLGASDPVTATDLRRTVDSLLGALTGDRQHGADPTGDGADKVADSVERTSESEADPPGAQNADETAGADASDPEPESEPEDPPAVDETAPEESVDTPDEPFAPVSAETPEP